MLSKVGLEIDYIVILSESDPFWGNGLEKEELLSVGKRGCELMKWIYDTNDMKIVIVAHGCLLQSIFEGVLTMKIPTNTCFAT